MPKRHHSQLSRPRDGRIVQELDLRCYEMDIGDGATQRGQANSPLGFEVVDQRASCYLDRSSIMSQGMSSSMSRPCLVSTMGFILELKALKDLRAAQVRSCTIFSGRGRSRT